MNYRGIIGSIYNLGYCGVLTPDGIDTDRYNEVCLNLNDADLKVFIKDYDNVIGFAQMGFWAEAGQILLSLFKNIGGGGGAQCPVCPPVPQKSLSEQLMPALIGFGLGYLIL